MSYANSKRSRSACASVQSDLGILYSSTYTTVYIYSVCEQQSQHCPQIACSCVAHHILSFLLSCAPKLLFKKVYSEQKSFIPSMSNCLSFTADKQFSEVSERNLTYLAYPETVSFTHKKTKS